MECSIATLVACFSWSNLYIDSEMIAFNHGVQTYVYRDWWTDNRSNFVNERTEIDRRAKNPYGRLSIGYQIEFTNVTLAIEAEHTSSLSNHDDRGVNGLSINARWYPFRR